jgi:hypothetical protein
MSARLFCIGFALIALCAITAQAKPITWYLQGVKFADGSTASGSFVYDVDNGFNGTYSGISIATTAGTTVPASAFAFSDPGAVSYSIRILPVTLGSGDLTGTPILILNFTAPLSDLGGTVSLVTSGSFASLWGRCLNSTCSDIQRPSPIAYVTAGSVTAITSGDASFYFTTHYSNANTSGAPDGTLRIINDGDQATTAVEGVENGTLWAAIYVFDDSQELRSCCACFITSDGLLSESVNKELTADEFTGRGEMTRGAIKVISSSSSNPSTPVPLTGLRGWMTHIQATSTTFPAPGPGNAVNAVEKGPWFVTEDALADSNLSATELANLGALCSYGLTIGSGYGLCPCTVEDYDF